MGSYGDRFVWSSKEAKDSVGDRLRHLLDKVVGGARVPLMNSTLSDDDVKKLSSLKGFDAVNTNSAPLKYESEPCEDLKFKYIKQENPYDAYDDREDIAMENIDQEISRWRQQTEGMANAEENVGRKSRARSKTSSTTSQDRDSTSSDNSFPESMFKCQNCDYQSHRKEELLFHLSVLHGLGTQFTKMSRKWNEMYRCHKMSRYHDTNNEDIQQYLNWVSH